MQDETDIDREREGETVTSFIEGEMQGQDGGWAGNHGYQVG